MYQPCMKRMTWSMSAKEPASAEAPSIGYIIAKPRMALTKAAMISIVQNKFFFSMNQMFYEAGEPDRKSPGSIMPTYSRNCCCLPRVTVSLYFDCT